MPSCPSRPSTSCSSVISSTWAMSTTAQFWPGCRRMLENADRSPLMLLVVVTAWLDLPDTVGVAELLDGGLGGGLASSVVVAWSRTSPSGWSRDWHPLFRLLHTLPTLSMGWVAGTCRTEQDRRGTKVRSCNKPADIQVYLGFSA